MINPEKKVKPQSKKEIYNILKTMLADRFGMQEQYIQSDHAFSAYGADSLDVVELIMELEDIFSIQIEDEKIVELTTVGDVATYIIDKVKSNAEHSKEDESSDQ